MKATIKEGDEKISRVHFLNATNENIEAWLQA